jgi:hypothetical protein
MSRFITIKRKKGGGVILPRVRWCDSFFCRLRGLMFRRALAPGEALLIVEGGDSRMNTSIHMFFVPFPIATVWINDAGRVVDKVEALPWRPFYAPRAPARYILETDPQLLKQVTLGEDWLFEDVPATPVRR